MGRNKIHAYIFIKYLTIRSRVDKNYILNSQILIKERIEVTILNNINNLNLDIGQKSRLKTYNSKHYVNLQ